jgi:hypothetical protein
LRDSGAADVPGSFISKGAVLMGHLLFIILHILALLFGFVGLILTIPLHLIYSAIDKK